MRKVGIVGIGQMPMKARYTDKMFHELAFDATRLALADARLTIGDIESAVYSVYNEMMMLQTMSDQIMHDYIGLTNKPQLRVTAGASTGGHSLKAAYNEIASGCSDVVLLLGVQKGADLIDLELNHRGEGFWTIGPTAMDLIWHAPYFSTVPALFALVLTAHMHQYGSPTEEQMAKISVKNHEHALDNPFAQLKKRLTVDEVLNSRLIAWPITMFECCLYSECATALILASEEKAKEISKKPVWLSGVAATCGSTSPQPGGKMAAVESAGKIAYKMAGVTDPLNQFDLWEVHDLVSGIEILYYEELGLCAPGQGGKLVDEGVTAKGGKLVVNRSGGRTAAGHVAGASGIFSAAEVVRQLREEAGERQVPLRNGRGLVQTIGGPGMAATAVAVLER